MNKLFTKKAMAMGMAAVMAVTSVVVLDNTASAATYKNLKKATVSKSVVVGKGKKVKIAVTKVPKKTKLSFKVAKKSIATVDKKGVVKGKKVGKTTVTVKLTYKGKSKTKKVKVTVKNPVKKITLKTTNKTLTVGKKFTLKVKAVTPKNASKNVTFSTSKKSVATVSAKGVVKAKKAGKATITVKATDGSNKKATCKVTVVAAVATQTPTSSAVVTATATATATATTAPTNTPAPTNTATTPDTPAPTETAPATEAPATVSAKYEYKAADTNVALVAKAVSGDVVVYTFDLAQKNAKDGDTVKYTKSVNGAEATKETVKVSTDINVDGITAVADRDNKKLTAYAAKDQYESLVFTTNIVATTISKSELEANGVEQTFADETYKVTAEAVATAKETGKLAYTVDGVEKELKKTDIVKGKVTLGNGVTAYVFEDNDNVTVVAYK